MATAARGQPNKLLTLTVNITTGESSGHRRDLLHQAWRNLVKRINRQFQLPPERRWILTGSARSSEKEREVRTITSHTPAKEVTSVPYFAFLERTKRGEPHLHILLRIPYIPQDWISEQMLDMLGSPIVWIEAIKGTRQAIAYVTKYVTKAPAQWGNKKRYWQSRNWAPSEASEDDDWRSYNGRVIVERRSWADLARGRAVEGWTHEITPEGWHRFWRPGQHPNWSNLHPWVPHHAEPQSVPPPHPP